MFPAMTGKPTDISKIVSLDLAHQERQMQTFTPRAPLHEHTGRLHPRWVITGAATYANPVDNHAPTRRSARCPGVW
jgi:hypothetical protein